MPSHSYRYVIDWRPVPLAQSSEMSGWLTLNDPAGGKQALEAENPGVRKRGNRRRREFDPK